MALNIEYYQGNEAEWDDFVCDKSMNGTFLQTRKFINYHVEGKFKDCSICIRKGNELVVEDDVFFEKLVSCIDGKPVVQGPYYPEYIYVVEIEKYDFALHDEHIFIYYPLGYNIKGVEIICVECTQEEISDLIEILDVVN